jgi:hypothetical protein
VRVRWVEPGCSSLVQTKPMCSCVVSRSCEIAGRIPVHITHQIGLDAPVAFAVFKNAQAIQPKIGVAQRLRDKKRILESTSQRVERYVPSVLVDVTTGEFYEILLCPAMAESRV